MTYLTKSLFLCDYRTKSDGFFAEMQIISYSFTILKRRHLLFVWCVWPNAMSRLEEFYRKTGYIHYCKFKIFTIEAVEIYRK